MMRPGPGDAPPVDSGKVLRIGDWSVRLAEGLLVRDDEEVRLRPRTMAVLALLARRPGEVVSKDEILAEVWEGSAVEEGALAHCVSEIRGALGDAARDPRYVETLPKRGYRLVATVTADPPTPDAPGERRSGRRAVAGILVGLVIATLVALIVKAGTDRLRRDTGPGADVHRAKVAVLGFSNLSQDPQARWLSTALSEMLTTELAVSEVVRPIPTDVVARARRELSIDDADRLDAETLRRLRASLGVDYAVVGSYLAPAADGSDAVRIDVRLQDNRSGEIVAAIVETGKVSELSDLVLFAGLRLRRSLGEEEHLANERELSTGRLPASPTAARLYFQGLLHLRRFEAVEATELLERSAAEHPDAPLTHFALAEAWSLLGYDTRATEAAGRALELSDSLPREDRLWVEARCHALAARWDEAIERLQALRLLDPEGLEYGLELARAQLSSGDMDGARETLASLERREEGAIRDPRIGLLVAEAAAASGDPSRSVTEAARARELAQELGARPLTGRALLLEAQGLYRLGRVEEAERSLDQAGVVFAEVGDRKSEADARTTLADWLWQRGAFERSQAVAREALATYHEIGNRDGEAVASRRLAINLWQHGGADEGEHLLLDALSTFREIGDRPGEAKTLSTLGIAVASFGGSDNYGPERSPCTLFEDALAIYRELDDRDGISAEVSNVGRCALIQGDVVEATRALEESAAIARDIGVPEGLATTLFNLGYAQSLVGDRAAAETSFQEAADLFRGLESSNMLGASLTGLGGVEMMAGDLQAAEADLEESVRLRRELGDPVRLASSLSELARLRLLQEEPEEAERLVREAIALADTTATSYGADSRMDLGFLLLETGRPDAARDTLEAIDGLVDPSAPINVRLLAGRITYGRALGATGDPDAGRALLAEVIDYATGKGLERFRLQAELARLEIDARAGLDAPARQRVKELAAQARRRGLVLVARTADAVLALDAQGAPEVPTPEESVAKKSDGRRESPLSS